MLPRPSLSAIGTVHPAPSTQRHAPGIPHRAPNVTPRQHAPGTRRRPPNAVRTTPSRKHCTPTLRSAPGSLHPAPGARRLAPCALPAPPSTPYPLPCTMPHALCSRADNKAGTTKHHSHSSTHPAPSNQRRAPRENAWCEALFSPSSDFPAPRAGGKCLPRPSAQRGGSKFLYEFSRAGVKFGRNGQNTFWMILRASFLQGFV